MKDILVKQYQGFLNTPQLFIDSKVLGVKPFYTKEKVNLSVIEDYTLELSKHKYLGKRAEIFLLAFLNSSNRYSNIIHSFQIHTEQKTIGELDIVCFDTYNDKWIHIELVYKLYVYTGESQFEDFSYWIGPNLKDRLDFKVKKLKSHQLPLGQHTEILNKINSADIESFCCYKAKLFLNAGVGFSNDSKLNPDCINGIYLNFEEFKSLKYQKSVFFVPEKIDWICDAYANKYWYAYKKAEIVLKTAIKEKRSKLVWQKTEDHHYKAYFVVWW